MSEKQPGNAAAQALEQARAEIAKGNSAAAVTFVRQAVGRTDTSPTQLAEAAQLAATLGIEEAFTWMLRAGRLQFDDGNLDGARATFEAARTLDQKNYEPIFELGRVEIASGRKAEGLGRFAEVLRKSNYTFVPALFEAGCVYEAEDSNDQAILTFKRIVERDKNHAPALAHLGKLHRMKQMAPESIAYFLQAAEAARKIMDYQLALQCARDILEFDPANVRARGLEVEIERILPEPRAKAPASKETPKPVTPPPPPVQAAVAGVIPPDFKLIEQQSKATLELAQVTASVAEAYKQRLAIEEQIKAAQAALESISSSRSSADQDLAAIKAQLDNVAKARAGEEASLAAISAKLEHTRNELAAAETLLDSVKQADEQRQTIAAAIEKLRADATGVKERSEKAKTDAGSVEKALAEVAASFSALRQEAEGAKAALDDAKARAEKAKADAAAAEATTAEARAKFEAANARFEAAEKHIHETVAHANAVASDAAATLSGVTDVETGINATLAAQKGLEDAMTQLRTLAAVLTERRKQTEATLAQIQGMGEPQSAVLSEADIAKLEAGLTAAIEKAAAAAKQPPPKPQPAPATPPVAPAASPAAKSNGSAQAAPAPAASTQPAAKPTKDEPAKPAEKAADKAPEKAPEKPGKPADKAGTKPAVKVYDNSPQGVYAHGLASLDANKPQDALKLFETLQSKPEFAILAQTAIGRCLAQMGQTEEAVARFSKALETPGHPEEQYHEALYYMAAAHASREDAESHELALWALEEIAAANAGYRDVAAQIETLKANAGKAAAGGSK